MMLQALKQKLEGSLTALFGQRDNSCSGLSHRQLEASDPARAALFCICKNLPHIPFLVLEFRVAAVLNTVQSFSFEPGHVLSFLEYEGSTYHENLNGAVPRPCILPS